MSEQGIWRPDVEHRDGVAWTRAPKPLTRFHRHRWQTRAWLGGSVPYIERCACGAANEGDGDWFYWPRARGRDKPRVRLF